MMSCAFRNHIMFGAGTPLTSQGNTTVVPYSPKVSGLMFATNVGASTTVTQMNN